MLGLNRNGLAVAPALDIIPAPRLGAIPGSQPSRGSSEKRLKELLRHGYWEELYFRLKLFLSGGTEFRAGLVCIMSFEQHEISTSHVSCSPVFDVFHNPGRGDISFRTSTDPRT